MSWCLDIDCIFTRPTAFQLNKVTALMKFQYFGACCSPGGAFCSPDEEVLVSPFAGHHLTGEHLHFG